MPKSDKPNKWDWDSLGRKAYKYHQGDDTFPEGHFGVTDRVNIFDSVPISPASQPPLHSPLRCPNVPSLNYRGDTPTPHHLYRQHLHRLALFWSTQVWPYTDNILLRGETQEATAHLKCGPHLDWLQLGHCIPKDEGASCGPRKTTPYQIQSITYPSTLKQAQHLLAYLASRSNIFPTYSFH